MMQEIKTFNIEKKYPKSVVIMNFQNSGQSVALENYYQNKYERKFLTEQFG